jgi:transposase
VGGRRRGQPPKLTAELREAVVEAVADGATLAQAADAVGVTKTTIINTQNRDFEFAEQLHRARAHAANWRQKTPRPVAAPGRRVSLYDLTAPSAPLAQAS